MNFEPTDDQKMIVETFARFLDDHEAMVAEGVPTGVLACNDDADCADRPDTRCQPEESGSLTTGMGVQARSYVKVCR